VANFPGREENCSQPIRLVCQRKLKRRLSFTVTDLIDVGKNIKNVLYEKMKKKKNCFVVIFFI
jgi:hypothetical protein